MRHFTKLIALLIALAMALGMASALAEGGKTYGGNDVSEHVELVLYYVGNPIGDEEMVFARVNEIMNEKINATINFKALDMSSYSQKYDLPSTSGLYLRIMRTRARTMLSEPPHSSTQAL